MPQDAKDVSMTIALTTVKALVILSHITQSFVLAQNRFLDLLIVLVLIKDTVIKNEKQCHVFATLS